MKPGFRLEDIEAQGENPVIFGGASFMSLHNLRSDRTFCDYNCDCNGACNCERECSCEDFDYSNG